MNDERKKTFPWLGSVRLGLDWSNSLSKVKGKRGPRMRKRKRKSRRKRGASTSTRRRTRTQRWVDDTVPPLLPVNPLGPQ